MATSCSIGLVDGGTYGGVVYACRANFEASLTYSQVIKDDGKYIRVVISGVYYPSYQSLSGYTMKAPNSTIFTVTDISSTATDTTAHNISNTTYTYEYKYNVLSALNFQYSIYAWAQCVPQYNGKQETKTIDCTPSTTIGVSAISASSANIGQATRITITNMDDSYTNNLSYKVNDTTTLIAENVTGTYDWVIPTSLFSLLESTSKSVPIRLIVETFSGTISLGEDIVDISGIGAEADCQPLLTPLITVLNPQTALTGADNIGIAGYNQVNVKPQATAQYNATIVSITTKHNGVSKSGEEVEFDLGNDTFTIVATDSRGYSTTQVTSIPLVAWFKPTLTFTASNPDAENNSCEITANGAFFNSSFGAQDNVLSVKAKWKQANGEYSELTDMVITPNGNSYKATYTATLDYTKQWSIIVECSDTLASVTGKEVVVITLPVFDWSYKDFNFNVPIKINSQYYLIPLGGSSGQVLSKGSATDYDTQWISLPTISGGTDEPSGGKSGDIYFQYTE